MDIVSFWATLQSSFIQFKTYYLSLNWADKYILIFYTGVFIITVIYFYLSTIKLILTFMKYLFLNIISPAFGLFSDKQGRFLNWFYYQPKDFLDIYYKELFQESQKINYLGIITPSPWNVSPEDLIKQYYLKDIKQRKIDEAEKYGLYAIFWTKYSIIYCLKNFILPYLIFHYKFYFKLWKSWLWIFLFIMSAIYIYWIFFDLSIYLLYVIWELIKWFLSNKI